MFHCSSWKLVGITMYVITATEAIGEIIIEF